MHLWGLSTERADSIPSHSSQQNCQDSSAAGGRGPGGGGEQGCAGVPDVPDVRPHQMCTAVPLGWGRQAMTEPSCSQPPQPPGTAGQRRPLSPRCAPPGPAARCGCSPNAKGLKASPRPPPVNLHPPSNDVPRHIEAGDQSGRARDLHGSAGPGAVGGAVRRGPLPVRLPAPCCPGRPAAAGRPHCCCCCAQTARARRRRRWRR